MASKITIKRSTAALPPAGLSFGELAFVQGTGLTADRLYVGISGGNPVWIGAEIGTTGTWTDTNAQTSLATQYAIDQRISTQISGSNVITTAADTTNATKYLVFTSGAGAGVTLGVDTGSPALSYNPFTNSLVIGGDLTLYSGDLLSSKVSSDIFPSVVRNLNIGLSAGITMGSLTGSSRIRNPTLILGTTGATIATTDGSLQLNPGKGAGVGGSLPSITIDSIDNATGFVNIEGGNLRLGIKTDNGASTTAVNLVFEGTTNNAFDTTLTVVDPTANRTISLPNDTDTLVGKQTVDTFTNKTYDTAGTGNVFRINGVTLTANTGTGSNVLATSPTLVTPTLGVASATTINKVTLTAPATGSTITVADGKTLTASNTLTFTGTDASTVAFGAGGTVLYTGNLGAGVATFLATPSSANLISAVTDEIGSGSLVFGTSPTITTSLVAGSSTFALLNDTATTINFAGGASTALNIGHASGNANFAGNVIVTGDLTVNGTTTTLNTTTLAVEDFNITMGLTLTTANATCTGAGIGIGVGTGITFAYDHATSAGWLSSVNLDLATAKTYKIGGTTVLSSSALGSGVTGSSLTQVGTITSGTWSGLFGAVSGASLTNIIAANVAVASDTSDPTCFVTFVNDTSGNLATKVNSTLTYNAQTGELSATLIDGGSF